MYKIGVIGDYDSIFGFSAVGFDIFPVVSAEQAGKELKALANSGYGIVFLTEQYMEDIEADCAVFDECLSPCIVPIPACSGVTGFGESRLKRFVEQAVGSDILFSDNG